MPIIAARNFATGTQQYLSLSAEDYMRPLSIGTSWNRIRIGILCSVSTVSENAWPIRNASLSLSVCNATGFNSSMSVLTTGHSVGAAWPVVPRGITGNSFTYNAGTAGNSYFNIGSFQSYLYAGGSLTAASVGSFSIFLPSNTTLGGAIARRGIVIVDINKSALNSGNITQGMSCGAVQHMALDITTADLYSALETYTTIPSVQGTALTNLVLGNTIAFNEVTNGPLNAVSVYWTAYTVPLQLYEIAVYRVG